MNRKILIGLVLIGLSAATASFGAKQLPALYDLTASAGPTPKDYNVIILHLQEDERVIAGLQKQVTVLHALLKQTRKETAFALEHLHKLVK